MNSSCEHNSTEANLPNGAIHATRPQSFSTGNAPTQCINCAELRLYVAVLGSALSLFMAYVFLPPQATRHQMVGWIFALGIIVCIWRERVLAWLEFKKRYEWKSFTDNRIYRRTRKVWVALTQ